MTATEKQPSPVVLCILDGWGNGPANENNAIAATATPVYDRLLAKCPVAELLTSAGDVGLPAGQMGNSEVGHQNIGGGRVVIQDLPRIDAAIGDSSLANRATLQNHIEALKNSRGACHLMGLLSPGGVHSHQDHMVALAKIIAAAGVKVKIHAFLDGRDTPPRSAYDFIEAFQKEIDTIEEVEITTVSGRYYAMDRDKRWDRVSKAYHAIVDGAGEIAANAISAVTQSYADDVSDEFVLPTAIAGYAGMADGDGVLMANFRADRAREILTALLDPSFDGFTRKRVIETATALGMTSYSTHLDAFMPAIFAAKKLRNTLGEVVSAAGKTQLRIAETEKYAHVTFFLNGGEEQVFKGEERILIPSPKVATYDLQPEMSAAEVTDRLVEAITTGGFGLIVVNYANPDMVGHTGVMAAAQKAVATIDICLGRLETALRQSGGAMLITADHGNIECLVDPANGETHTAHTTNSVPFILINGGSDMNIAGGRLADVAPTVLELMNLPIPQEMTGASLLRPGQRTSETSMGHRAQA